jgi:hypothetical protein
VAAADLPGLELRRQDYLLGKRPPAFDVLYWNQDSVRLAAGLHRDFVRLTLDKSVARAGGAEVLGSPVDLGKVDVDRANKGAAGVDEQSMAEFEEDLSGNLSKLWNRLSSGSYLPPPVRAVEIPKRDGGSRLLGVPTVADRIVQTVVRSYLEPGVERVFHRDSSPSRLATCPDWCDPSPSAAMAPI